MYTCQLIIFTCQFLYLHVKLYDLHVDYNIYMSLVLTSFFIINVWIFILERLKWKW